MRLLQIDPGLSLISIDGLVKAKELGLIADIEKFKDQFIAQKISWFNEQQLQREQWEDQIRLEIEEDFNERATLQALRNTKQLQEIRNSFETRVQASAIKMVTEIGGAEFARKLMPEMLRHCLDPAHMPIGLVTIRCSPSREQMVQGALSRMAIKGQVEPVELMSDSSIQILHSEGGFEMSVERFLKGLAEICDADFSNQNTLLSTG